MDGMLHDPWMAAERDGRDEAADTAFRGVFATLAPHTPAKGFRDRTMQAVALAAARRARRRARLRAAAAACVTLAPLALTIAAAPVVGSWMARLLTSGIEMSVRGVVWLALALEGGVDAWTIVSQVGRAAGAVIAAPQVTAALIVVELVGVAAFIGLQRLLVSEQESVR